MYEVSEPKTPLPLYELPSEKRYRTAKDLKTHHPLPSIHDAASLDLSIIIPAYNETQHLSSMLSSTLEHLASFAKRTFEVLIIDDGSADGTATAALKLAAESYPKADIRVGVHGIFPRLPAICLTSHVSLPPY